MHYPEQGEGEKESYSVFVCERESKSKESVVKSPTFNMKTIVKYF